MKSDQLLLDQRYPQQGYDSSQITPFAEGGVQNGSSNPRLDRALSDPRMDNSVTVRHYAVGLIPVVPQIGVGLIRNRDERISLAETSSTLFGLDMKPKRGKSQFRRNQDFMDDEDVMDGDKSSLSKPHIESMDRAKKRRKSGRRGGYSELSNDDNIAGVTKPTVMDHTSSSSNQVGPLNLKAIFMLCSVSLGVGVFVLPFLLVRTGVLTGVLILLMFAILATFAQLITIDCAQITGVQSFEELANVTFGRTGEFFLASFMAVSLFTGNAAHIQTVGSLLHDIIDWYFTGSYGSHHFDWEKKAILYVTMLCLTGPWLFQKNLHGLSGVGTMSVTVVMITALSLIGNCFWRWGHDNWARGDTKPIIGFSKTSEESFWVSGFWQICPTFAFTYTSLLELFPVYLELHHRNVAATKQSIKVASFICFAIYSGTAVLVVLTFGTDLDENCLYNIPPQNYWITFCCFCLVIVITLLYPVINYPLMSALEAIIELCNCCQSYDLMTNPQNYRRGSVDEDLVHRSRELYAKIVEPAEMMQRHGSSIDLDDESSLSVGVLFEPQYWPYWVIYHRREVMSIVGMFFIIAVDIGVQNLADLFGLCGSLGLSFVCYIFPTVIFLHLKWYELSWFSFQFWFAIAVCLFATTVMIYSTTVIIMSILGG